MARFLIVGAGPNATALVDVLERDGHVVSAVTHTDRRALEHVAIVCWLEGRTPERFLLASVDSSMRGFVYQAHDWERVALETAERNSIPMVALRSDQSDVAVWLAEAQNAIASLIGAPGGSMSARYADR
ncbi:MAG: hypothetical protein WBV85_10120 [Solirubrobacteraceae bacterium]